jgi:hypothetical protein
MSDEATSITDHLTPLRRQTDDLEKLQALAAKHGIELPGQQ